MGDSKPDVAPLLWKDLAADVRDAIAGKLTGLWGAVSDEAAFDNFAIDKQQALLIIASRMRAKELWHVVNKIDNVYGEGGVGCFSAWRLSSRR